MPDTASSRSFIGVTEPSNFTSDCIDCIEDFYGATPLKLCQNKIENLYAALSMCSGVMLAGGVDIHPMCYGNSVYNDFGATRFDLKRDKRELQIIHYCFKHDIPIFGICRGHQMLGIYHGMTLIMDLAESVVCHSPQKQQISFRPDEPMHAIQLITDEIKLECKEFEVIQETFSRKDPRQLFVNSFHHQAILFDDKKGARREEQVRILAVATAMPKTKIVEIMTSLPTRPRWVSCQFHPEYDYKENTVSRWMLQQFKDMMTKK